MTVAVTQRTSPEMKYLELFKNMACSGILTVANNQSGDERRRIYVRETLDSLTEVIWLVFWVRKNTAKKSIEDTTNLYLQQLEGIMRGQLSPSARVRTDDITTANTVARQLSLHRVISAETTLPAIPVDHQREWLLSQLLVLRLQAMFATRMEDLETVGGSQRVFAEVWRDIVVLTGKPVADLEALIVREQSRDIEYPPREST